MKFYAGVICFMVGWVIMLVMVMQFGIFHWWVILPPLAGMALIIYIPVKDTEKRCRGGIGCCKKPCK